jgi:hypothetical protein
MTETGDASAHHCVHRAGVMGKVMSLNTEDDVDAAGTAEPGQEPLAPYLALDRLLRYARSEALSQHREKTASLIEAAIISLPDPADLSRH